jgi:phosphoglycerate dehydrogenase-like enzyme
VELVDLDQLFQESDFLTVNCPLNAHTAKIVNAERLASMKSTAYVINTARGGVIDQAALAHALKHDIIAGAAIDVFDPEPPAVDDPIFEAAVGEKLIATPHAICWTDQVCYPFGVVTSRHLFTPHLSSPFSQHLFILHPPSLNIFSFFIRHLSTSFHPSSPISSLSST